MNNLEKTFQDMVKKSLSCLQIKEIARIKNEVEEYKVQALLPVSSKAPPGI